MQTPALTLNHSISRRLKNFLLAPSPDNALLGVYEAISNSIHAAEETNNSAKVTINVQVIRDEDGDLSGFRIVDDAVGLTEQNFESFRNVDSDFKIRRGGKGVGRFTWLKTFEKVHVESWYFEDRQCYRREFTFVLDDANPFYNYSLSSIDATEPRTIVELLEMRKSYSDVAPKRGETLLKSITRHFVRDLISASAPKIIVEDGSITELNTFFNNNIIRTDNDDFQITIGENLVPFTVRHFLASGALKDHETNENTLYFLAHGRVVDRRGIGGLIGLKTLAHGQTYLGLVESQYFDEGVSQERTMFALNVDLIDQVTRAAATKAVVFLSNETAPIRIRQTEMLRHIRREFPRYIGTIRDAATFAQDKLPLSARDQETIFRAVSLEWYRNKRRLDREIRVGLRQANTPDQIRLAVEKLVSAVDAETKAALADYIAERKVIIDLLHDLLAKIRGGSYQLEGQLHDIICARGQSSDSINYDSHNLWLLDERLPYYTYFNSDKAISQQTESGEGTKRPDITFYDIALSFQQPREAVPIIIVEFKRPGRDDYTTSENPIDQCLDYVNRIKSGNGAIDSEGRIVSWIRDDSLFYCYVIADIMPSLRDIVTKHDLTRTPDGRGYWKYHDRLKTMIELVPFDRLVDSNRARHEAFFEKLGIN
jgi:hypothetical protein